VTKPVAEKYSVSPCWIRFLKQRRRQAKRVAPAEQRHGPKPGWELHADKIRLAVLEALDLTLGEYIQRYALRVSKSALSRGWRPSACRAKSRSGPASRTARA
jgi:hypothetical protein